MKEFGGNALFIDRSDINTDEIIPAKYLTEISKEALKPHLLEDLLVDGRPYEGLAEALENTQVVVARENFGCGSSREHAVWAFEVNDINIIIAESFARIFRQNMFNCGILAIELAPSDLARLFTLKGSVSFSVDMESLEITATSDADDQAAMKFSFEMNSFDKDLVSAGGWLAYADSKY